MLAWHVQRKCIPLAKTTKEERLLENISGAYSVKLTASEVKQIDSLDANIRLFNPKWMSGFGWNGMPYNNILTDVAPAAIGTAPPATKKTK